MPGGNGCILRFPFQALWQLKIDNIKVDGEIVVTDIPAVIDTGADLIIGDLRRVLAIHRAAGGRSFASKGMSIYYTGEFLFQDLQTFY
jgi:hypothetical protein